VFSGASWGKLAGVVGTAVNGKPGNIGAVWIAKPGELKFFELNAFVRDGPGEDAQGEI
jgi:hypothetical protein